MCYLVTGAGIAAGRAEAQAVPKIRSEKYTLPNGLEVILHEDHSTPIVTVNTWYKVGSGDEKPGRTGFAHLFEHRSHIWVSDSERRATGTLRQ